MIGNRTQTSEFDCDDHIYLVISRNNDVKWNSLQNLVYWNFMYWSNFMMIVLFYIWFLNPIAIKSRTTCLSISDVLKGAIFRKVACYSVILVTLCKYRAKLANCFDWCLVTSTSISVSGGNSRCPFECEMCVISVLKTAFVWSVAKFSHWPYDGILTAFSMKK